MGKGSRDKPLRLAEKLKQIREQLKVSQDGILIRLGGDDFNLRRTNISQFELGTREPSLMVLYAYAQAANVYIDVLVDDDLDLPVLIPSPEKSMGRKKRK